MSRLVWKIKVWCTKRQFFKIAGLARTRKPEILPKDIDIQFFHAPHQKYTSVPRGKCAVYMFIDPKAGKVLKCGKSAQKPKPGKQLFRRRIGQHYTAARGSSTLANSMINDLNNYHSVTKAKAGQYIKENFHLVVLLIDVKHNGRVLDTVERFFQVKFDPKYEG
jgi:hypothetical protein